MKKKLKNEKKLFLLFPKNKKNKNITLSLDMPSRMSFFSPVSFSSPKCKENNTITNYNYKSPIRLYLKDKISSKSIKNYKQNSIIRDTEIKNKKNNENKVNSNIYSLTKNNSMSSTTFSSLINKKLNQNYKNELEKNSLTIDERSKLNSIIKNFNDNSIITMELYSLDKHFPLNSLTKSNFRFLSNENKKYINKKNDKKNKKQDINKNFMTTLSMIGQFNHKSKNFLQNKSLKGIKFSKNMNEFRKQIINSYTDTEKKIKDIKKNKYIYNDALNIFEEFNEQRIKEAQLLEVNFYKEKSSSLYHGKPLYLYIKELNRQMSKKNIKLVMTEKNSEDESQKTHKNNMIYPYSKFINSKGDNKLNIQHNSVNNKKRNEKEKEKGKEKKFERSEKDFIKSKKKYEKYLRKKIRNKAKMFADSLYEIKDLLPEAIQKKTISPRNNCWDMTNLKKIVKLNTIRNNLFSIEDDDLLINNIKKLKEEIRDAEDSYYTIFRGKYNIEFLKKNIKPSTIQKLNIMKNSHFGLPC